MEDSTTHRDMHIYAVLPELNCAQARLEPTEDVESTSQ